MTDTNQERDLRVPPEEDLTNGGNSDARGAPNEEQRPASEPATPDRSTADQSTADQSTADQFTERRSPEIGTKAAQLPVDENGRGGGREQAGDGSPQPIALVGDPEGLRRQWDSVQVGFVDDPRNAVREADALVSAAIEDLAAGFSDQRSRLEAAWAGGSDASTDDLRGAFRTYRDFFERLLNV